MQIIAIMLVKNESERWLRETLTEVMKVCDRLVVIDDGSTDYTAQICEIFGATVVRKEDSLWATNEIQRRKELWALAEPQHGDWVVCLDADEILVNAREFRQVITMAHEEDAVAVPLFDMWNDSQYRYDSYWTAHVRNWIVAVKYNKYKQYEWRETALHCGRFPINSATKVWELKNTRIKHMGWSTPEDRLAKYTRYMLADGDGKYGCLEQYKSILDEDPNLEDFV